MNPELMRQQNHSALLVALGVAASAQLYRWLLWLALRKKLAPSLASTLRQLLWLIGALSAGSVTAGVALTAPSPELLMFVPLFLVVLLPWGAVRRVLIPLGQVRAAHAVARLSDLAFDEDQLGGPALAAAMALLHKTNASDEDAAWVEAQVAQARPLKACGLAAAAVLRLRSRDVDGARRLFESVELLNVPHNPLLSLRVSLEWLAADAAARGDWARVASLVERPGSFFVLSRATRLLGAVARRLLRRADAPSDEALWALWLLAPARRSTRPLLRRALLVPQSPVLIEEVVPQLSEPASPADPLQAALSMQARLMRQESPSVPEVVALGDAWDKVLSDQSFERRLLVRSMELGTHDGPRVRSQLAEAAAAQLAACARARSLPLGSVSDPGPTVERATRLLRDELFTGLEAACEALRQRAIDRRELPPVDEWREWLAIRARHEELASLAGPAARRLAWPKVRDDVCKLAVWLWNVRGEKNIAHVMFRWLLSEATALDDHEGIELQKKNVDCGY